MTPRIKLKFKELRRREPAPTLEPAPTPETAPTPEPAPPTDPELDQLALVSGSHNQISEGQLKYHLDAEKGMDEQWATLIWPLIKDSDFSVTVDLAAGYGRNSVKLLPLAGQLILVDINQECVDFCQRRFQGHSNVRFIKNDGASLKALDDASVTFVYSFDAMVHFDSDIVRSYLREFQRILKPGGTCFCHHSNSMAQPGGGLTPPHSRNFMSRELYAHYGLKAGLTVVQQTEIDWGGYKNHDCLSTLQKPLQTTG